MTTLVVGASGATGRLLVAEMLKRGKDVKIVVRSPDSLPEAVKSHDNVTVIRANILDVSETEMARHVKGCDAVASCLGHNMSLKGIFVPPRRLVTEATRRLCSAIKATEPREPVKFVLMNTAGNSNRDLVEEISLAEKCVVGLVRLMLPPHADNESASDYLRIKVGQNHQAIEWAVVRPDSLIDEIVVTDSEIQPSPTRSAIFNAGLTSRINVAHFMADLMTDHDTWNKWKGKMPVIYNRHLSD